MILFYSNYIFFNDIFKETFISCNVEKSQKKLEKKTAKLTTIFFL